MFTDSESNYKLSDKYYNALYESYCIDYTDQELSVEDEDYVNDVRDCINGILNSRATQLDEEFTSYHNAEVHFDKHCIRGTNLDRRNPCYRIGSVEDYQKYENYLYSKVMNIISKNEDLKTLDTSDYVNKLRRLSRNIVSKPDIWIVFNIGCGLLSPTTKQPCIIAIHSFCTELTANNKGRQTLDLIVINSNLKTVALYPILDNFLAPFLDAQFERSEKDVRFCGFQDQQEEPVDPSTKDSRKERDQARKMQRYTKNFKYSDHEYRSMKKR